MDKLHKLVQNRALMKYLVVGVSVYLLELLVIFTAQRLGASSVLAVASAFWIGLLVSFVLQKFVTFGDDRTHHRVVLAQFFAVTMLVLWNFVFTLLITALTTHVLPAAVARTIALGITTIWNFYLYKTRIFHTDESPVY